MNKDNGRKTTTQWKLFAKPFTLARQRTSWSPRLIAGELWRLLTNFGTQREILAFLSLPPFNKVVLTNPGLAFKYLIPDYLARGFTVNERASCFMHHYRRLHAALPKDVLLQILVEDVILRKISKGGTQFALTIGLPRSPSEKEGELSLNLQVDGEAIFTLSFIIAPGWVVRSEAAEILLITRLQGSPASKLQIKHVLKALREYSPRKLLLAALQGIGDALGINQIAAVCASTQRSYDQECAAILKRSYDHFFATIGMAKTPTGFFFSSIPIEGKPLALFRGRQKRFAIERRALRQEMQSACADFFLAVDDPAVCSSSGSLFLAPVPDASESNPAPLPDRVQT